MNVQASSKAESADIYTRLPWNYASKTQQRTNVAILKKNPLQKPVSTAHRGINSGVVVNVPSSDKL